MVHAPGRYTGVLGQCFPPEHDSAPARSPLRGVAGPWGIGRDDLSVTEAYLDADREILNDLDCPLCADVDTAAAGDREDQVR